VVVGVCIQAQAKPISYFRVGGGRWCVFGHVYVCVCVNRSPYNKYRSKTSRHYAGIVAVPCVVISFIYLLIYSCVYISATMRARR
jgi:hypothetical protein